MRSRTIATSLLLAAACGLAACTTTPEEDSRDSFMSGMRREASRHEAEEARSAGPAAAPATTAGASRHPAPGAQPLPQPVALPDTRVMLYQPKGDLLLILVNESNTGRRSEEGRLALALGEPTRAYKILTDQQMVALLRSLNASGYEANAGEFLPEDAQYLTSGATEIPRYQGLISVESGPVKTRVLGFRKSSEGDALGLRRYQTYTRMKGLVQKWFSDSSRSEFPVGGVTIPPAKGPS